MASDPLRKRPFFGDFFLRASHLDDRLLGVGALEARDAARLAA